MSDPYGTYRFAVDDAGYLEWQPLVHVSYGCLESSTLCGAEWV